LIDAVKGAIGVNMNVINFYAVGEDYGCFSNFSPHPIRLRTETGTRLVLAHKTVRVPVSLPRPGFTPLPG
jgi:predicted NAD-dependent protein-ADP-ribosyltransferase YbiA (DUF1768 family)